MHDQTRTRFAELSLLGLTLIWGSTFSVIKFVGGDFDPVATLFYRFFFAVILFLPILVYRRVRWTADLRSGLLLGFALWLMFILQMTGLRHTTASKSAFITSLFVVTTPVFNFLLRGKKTTLTQGVGALVALAGLWLLTGGVDSVGLGDLLTLGAATACGVHITLLEERAQGAKSLLLLNFYQFAVCAALTGAYLAVTGGSFAVPNAAAWTVIFYLCLFGTIVCVVMQSWGQKYVPPMRAALLFALEPVVGTIIAWAWLGETMTRPQLLGAGLILAGTMVAVLRPSAAEAQGEGISIFAAFARAREAWTRSFMDR